MKIGQGQTYDIFQCIFVHFDNNSFITNIPHFLNKIKLFVSGNIFPTYCNAFLPQTSANLHASHTNTLATCLCL